MSSKNWLWQWTSAEPSGRATGFGLLFLRVVAGALIFWVHGWHKSAEALACLGDGTSWRLAGEVAEMHLPFPVFFALAATLTQLVCAPLLIAGWFARLNAALLAGALGGAVLQNLLAGRDPQLALLYTSVALALVFTGPGRFSLDRRLGPGTA